jgi:hypothetical protein
LLPAGLAPSRGAARGAAAGPGATFAGFTRGSFHGAQYIFQARLVPQVRQAVAACGAVAKTGFAAAALTLLAASRVLPCGAPRLCTVAGTGCLFTAVTGKLTLGELPEITVTGAGLPR